MTIQERNAILTRKRRSIVAACCVANLCLGCLYTWSIFAGPMAEYLNALNGTSLNSSDLALAFSFANSLTFITMIAGGYLENKIGARWVIFFGVVFYGVGFILCGLAKSPALVIWGFGVVGGLAQGLGYVCTVSTSVKFFPDKKGLIGGISTACFGISSVIIPPIADMLNRSVGVSRSFTIFGISIAVIGSLCSLFIKNCPADFVPTGWTNTKKELTDNTDDKTALQMIQSPVFYVMLAMMFVGATIGLMLISEASSVAQSMMHMSSGDAALIVSAMSLFSTGSRIIVGWISDRIGRIRTITLVFIVMTASLLGIYLSGEVESSLLFCACFCLLGFSYGSFMGVYPAFTSDQFGTRDATLNYGIMFIGFSLAGVVGPLMMQKVFRLFGAYQPVFLIGAVFSVIGILMTFLYRIVNKKAKNA